MLSMHLSVTGIVCSLQLPLQQRDELIRLRSCDVAVEEMIEND
jgi:hypothetical protein